MKVERSQNKQSINAVQMTVSKIRNKRGMLICTTEDTVWVELSEVLGTKSSLKFSRSGSDIRETLESENEVPEVRCRDKKMVDVNRG